MARKCSRAFFCSLLCLQLSVLLPPPWFVSPSCAPWAFTGSAARAKGRSVSPSCRSRSFTGLAAKGRATAYNNRANQMNPNHPSYSSSRAPAQPKAFSSSASRSQAALNNRANQMNPNHPSYSSGRAPAQPKAFPASAARARAPDRRADQLNPTNQEYWKSRGLHPPPADQLPRAVEKKAAAKKAAGNFEKRANNLAPKDKVDAAAVEDFTRCLREVCGGDSRVRTKGSRAKGNAISRSDFDYHIDMAGGMTEQQKDHILHLMRGLGHNIICKKAFTVTSGGSPDIDFFPPGAEWHPSDLGVESPGAKTFDPGAKRAIRKLKHSKDSRGWNVKSRDLEDEVSSIQREKGWNAANDPSGEKRFSEAQRRLSESEAGDSSGG